LAGLPPLPLLVAVGLAATLLLLLLPLAVGFLDPPPLLGLSKGTVDHLIQVQFDKQPELY
jgi:hypothetical protein